MERFNDIIESLTYEREMTEKKRISTHDRLSTAAADWQFLDALIESDVTLEFVHMLERYVESVQGERLTLGEAIDGIQMQVDSAIREALSSPSTSQTNNLITRVKAEIWNKMWYQDMYGPGYRKKFMKVVEMTFDPVQ